VKAQFQMILRGKMMMKMKYDLDIHVFVYFHLLFLYKSDLSALLAYKKQISRKLTLQATARDNGCKE